MSCDAPVTISCARIACRERASVPMLPLHAVPEGWGLDDFGLPVCAQHIGTSHDFAPKASEPRPSDEDVETDLRVPVLRITYPGYQRRFYEVDEYLWISICAELRRARAAERK